MYSPYSAILDLKSSFEPLRVSVSSPSSDGVSPGSDGMLHHKFGQQQPHPSTLSHSASCTRSKLIGDAGSVSDSGITSRAARSSRYLDVFTAHKGGVSLLDLQHRSPSSPCLSLPGYLSDSCTLERSSTSLRPSRLDVKRLLSKPAALNAVSTVSISSDPGSHAIPCSALNFGEAWPSRARMQSPSPESIMGPPTISGADSPRVDQSPTPPPPSSRQRPRNLLRKKSTSGPNQTRAVTSATVPSDMSISSPLQSPTRLPDASPSRSQRSTTLQGLVKSRAPVPASARPSGSGRLTPAGAIIQAYKEQDSRREALAAAANIEKRSPIIPISAAWVDASDNHAPERNAAPPAGCAPCHMELSRSPHGFVMVDSPSGPGYGDRPASPNAGQPIKSLTRKVSARFRRGLAAVSGAGAQSGRGHDDGEGEQMNRRRSNTDGRDRRERQLSLEPHNAKHKPPSLSLSIDSPPPSTPSSGLMNPWDERLGRTPQVESALGSPNTFTQSKGKEKMQAKVETGTGTRFWRLVKRISTGALRERSQLASAAPPPVPAVQKPLPDLPPRTTFEVLVPSGSLGGVEGAGPSDDGDGGKSVMNCHIDSSLSASGVASLGDDNSSTTACVPPGTHASPQGHSVGEHPRRPSLSSSPQSSEPTSHFFRSHSSRSSFSSIIANSPPPPVPIHPLARSPSPRTHLPAKNSPSPSTRRTSHDEPPSSSAPRTRSRGRSSPEMPTFSVSDVVNNFILRRPSLARHQRRHAPTRSMVYPRSTGDMSAGPLRRTGSEVRRTTHERQRVDRRSMGGSSGQNRDSHGSDTTVRRLAMPTGTHANADSSAERFTFRELGSERKQAWTSQEKEDKWHALLERSAQAGGTLHLGVGGAGLASDNIRFSSSTISFSSESSAIGEE